MISAGPAVVDETLACAEMLGLRTVPALYRGPWDRAKLIEIAEGLNSDQCEGYVARVTRAFQAYEFNRVVGKFVRQAHVRTSAHWMEGPVTPNGLASTGG